MNCPIDNTELKMSDRQGIEVDYCPTCRGVWLDRGELDKIIERTALVMEGAAPDDFARSARPADTREYRREERRDDDDYYRSRRGDDDYRHGYGSEHGSDTRKRKSRRSFLGDLFDID